MFFLKKNSMITILLLNSLIVLGSNNQEKTKHEKEDEVFEKRFIFTKDADKKAQEQDKLAANKAKEKNKQAAHTKR